MKPLALALSLTLASGAQAQQQITPDDFLDKATGNTLTFEHYPNGGLVGIEQFLSRSRTVWATPEGTCTYGKIEVRDEMICFIYEDLPVPEHCWIPFQQDGRMVVVARRNGAMQHIPRITQSPVICDDPAIS